MRIFVVICAAILFLTSGCAHNPARAGVSTINSPLDNSYSDLTPGGTLRVLIPLLKSGGYDTAKESPQIEGNTIVVSAPNLLGYKISHYVIEGRSSNRVRLQFRAAEVTKEGRTIQTTHPPELPFTLPSKAQRIRLIYLVRNSSADHNMAIASARDLGELNRFTARLKQDPRICRSDGPVYCAWVPTGIAIGLE